MLIFLELGLFWASCVLSPHLTQRFTPLFLNYEYREIFEDIILRFFTKLNPLFVPVFLSAATQFIQMM